MNLNEKFPVSPGKIEALKERLKKLEIDPNRIEEQFARGGGPGGQKINKSSTCVILRYPPLELSVKVQRARQRSLNRFLALRELTDRIEMRIAPKESRRLKKIERIRKQKSRRRRRHRQPTNDKTEASDMTSLKITIEKIPKETLEKAGLPPSPRPCGKWAPWECDPKTFDWEYSDTETAYIYEGKVRIKTPVEEVEIAAGDWVRFPKGLRCTWTVLEKVRKVYSFDD